MKYAKTIVELAKSWIGRKESDGTHKYIIDIYNEHRPLARNYKVKYTDAWCATTVSALAIKCGFTDIIPTECSCQKMIELFKGIGSWVENENRTPKVGDIIFYDWDDSGSGDNQGWSDHVGIVEKVSGTTIAVIEGNYGDAVKRRTLHVNGKYIRGYGVPKYDVEVVSKVETTTATAPSTTASAKVDSANSFLKSLSGTYKVTASALNVRCGAGLTKKVLVTIPKGTKVKCYGYYTKHNGVNWLYVRFTYKNIKYTGFSSMSYLSKVL